MIIEKNKKLAMAFKKINNNINIKSKSFRDVDLNSSKKLNNIFKNQTMFDDEISKIDIFEFNIDDVKVKSLIKKGTTIPVRESVYTRTLKKEQILGNLKEDIHFSKYQYNDSYLRSFTPYDVYISEQGSNQLEGSILALGIGSGLEIIMLSKNPKVSSVFVLEEDIDKIEMFSKMIAPYVSKVDIQFGSFNSLDTEEYQNYDFIIRCSNDLDDKIKNYCNYKKQKVDNYIDFLEESVRYELKCIIFKYLKLLYTFGANIPEQSLNSLLEGHISIKDTLLEIIDKINKDTRVIKSEQDLLFILNKPLYFIAAS